MCTCLWPVVHQIHTNPLEALGRETHSSRHSQGPSLNRMMQTPLWAKQEDRFRELRSGSKRIFNRGTFIFFKKDFIHLFLDRGEGREEEGERHQCVVASHVPLPGDLGCNPGMCPDWELNQ